MLSGLAAVTEHLGLAGTINATFNEPYELVRKLATLDHLSGDRAGWNAVTSSDAFTGENFRRGGFLEHPQRYERAEEFVRTVRELWDSWAEAQENAARIRRLQVSPQTAILLLEQLWNRDLSAYDPEGSLPEIDPDVSEDSIIQGRTRMSRDPLTTAAEWRALAESKRLGIRDLIIEATGRQSFVGSPARVAETWPRPLRRPITHDHADRVRSYEPLAEEWAKPFA